MNRTSALAGIMLAVVILALAGNLHSQGIVFIVRHAERADGGATQMQAQNDPPLSARGEARAVKLAEMLRDSGITAIYVSEFRRTRDTAKPIADRLGLEEESLSSRDIEGLVKRLHGAKPSENLLVVGHSNTVPAIIRALGGPETAIKEDEYDNLFLIVPRIGVMTRIRFEP